MLATATGVITPCTLNAQPISTTHLIRLGSVGFRRTANEILVRRPIGTRVILLG